MEQENFNTPNQCPRCGAEFMCGLATQQARCWCFDLPKVKLPRNEYAGKCLCPDCLRAVIDATQEAKQVETATSRSQVI